MPFPFQKIIVRPKYWYMSDLSCNISQAMTFVCPLIQFGLVYWGLTPQQQPGSYQGGEMMLKSVFWWRKPEYPETTGYSGFLHQKTDLPLNTLHNKLIIQDRKDNIDFGRNIASQCCPGNHQVSFLIISALWR